MWVMRLTSDCNLIEEEAIQFLLMEAKALLRDLHSDGAISDVQTPVSPKGIPMNTIHFIGKLFS